MGKLLLFGHKYHLQRVEQGKGEIRYSLSRDVHTVARASAYNLVPPSPLLDAAVEDY